MPNLANNSNTGGASASPFIAALLAPVCAIEEPKLPGDKRRAASEKALRSYLDADRRAEQMRALASLAQTDAAYQLFDEAWRELLSAADRLIRSPMPDGSRRDLDRIHDWKRHAARRCRYRAGQDDWPELLAADKALIPPPQPRKRKEAGNA